MLDGNVNSKRNIDVLEENLLLFAQGSFGLIFKFMQNNSPVHNSRVVSQWFKDAEIDVLNCSSKSPDLNPIENIWALLSRAVYSN